MVPSSCPGTHGGVQSSVGFSTGGRVLPADDTASYSGRIVVGGTVIPGVDLACSLVRDTCGADDVVAGGAASDSGGIGVIGSVLPGVDLP